jgi:hypothetical protein
MHQYKTIAQTLFVLSILNFVYAAPVLREAHDTLNEVVAPEDVISVSNRRRGALAPETDGSPTTHLSATDEVPLPDSTTVRVPTTEHPLSTTEGPVLVPDPNTPSTSSPPPLAAERPVSVPGSTLRGSTTSGYTQVTHDMLSKDLKFYQRPTVKKIAGFSLIASVVAAIVLFSSLNKSKDD